MLRVSWITSDNEWDNVTDGEFELKRTGRDLQKFNIFQILARNERSIFRGLDVEDLKKHLQDHLQVAPLTPYYEDQGGGLHREGFLLETQGSPVNYVYFAYPGAIMFMSRWRSPTGKLGCANLPYVPLPTDKYSPIYLNSLREHCDLLGTLRNTQIVGLLELSLAWFVVRGAVYGIDNTWMSNVVVANSTLVFRIESSVLKKLAENGALLLKGQKPGGGGMILHNATRETAFRLAEAHMRKDFEAVDSETVFTLPDHLKNEGIQFLSSGTVIFAKHLLDYQLSTALDTIRGNQYRIGFYAGLPVNKTVTAINQLLACGAMEKQKDGTLAYKLYKDNLRDIVQNAWNQKTS